MFHKIISKPSFGIEKPLIKTFQRRKQLSVLHTLTVKVFHKIISKPLFGIEKPLIKTFQRRIQLSLLHTLTVKVFHKIISKQSQLSEKLLNRGLHPLNGFSA